MTQRITSAAKPVFFAFKAGLLLSSLLFFAQPAFAAACSSPNGNAGDIVYSSTSSMMAYCNGSNWVAMGNNSSVGFGTLTTGDFCTAVSSTQVACTTATINAATQLSGTIAVPNGGTGDTSLTAHGILIGEGTSSVVVTGAPTAGQLLVGQSATTDPAFQTISGDATLGATGALTVASIGGKAVSLGSSFTTSGAYPLTLTTTASTNVTLPTSGTLVNTAVTTLSSLVSIGTVTTGTWNAGVITVPYGGTGLATLTTNTLYKGAGTSAMVASSFNDNGTLSWTTENFDVTSKAVVTEITNAVTPTTVLNKLAKLNISGAAILTTTSDTDGVVGVVTGDAGVAGNAQIAVSGQASCVFDGATTAGDYVTLSSSTAGDCKDAGGSRSLTGQTIGRVLSTNGSGGTYAVVLSINGAGGGAAAGSSGQVQFNSGAGTFAADSNLFWDNTNKKLGIGSAIPQEVLDLGTGNIHAATAVLYGASFARTNGPDLLAYGTGLGLSGKDATSTGLYLSSTNQIGVGTTAPTTLMTLYGTDFSTAAGPHVAVYTAADAYPVFYQLNWAHNNISQSFDAYYNGVWKSSSSGSNFQIYKTANQLQFNYANGVAVGSTITWGAGITLTSSGQVGIGTSSATGALTVQSSNPSTGSLKIQSSGTGQWNNLVFAENNGAIRLAIQKETDNSMGFYTGTGAAGSESYNQRMVIGTAGTVSIGTSAIWFPLFVAGSDATVYVPSSASVDSPQDATATVTVGVMNNSKVNGNVAYFFMTPINASGTYNPAYMGAVSTASSYTPSIVWGARTGNTSYAEWMRLDTSGRLGVGTTSPAYTIDSGTSGGMAGQVMHVYSVGSSVTTGASSGGISFGSGAAGQMAYYSGASAISATSVLNVSGSNIGIGTASPVTALDVTTSDTGTTLGASFAQIPVVVRNSSLTLNNWRMLGFYADTSSGLAGIGAQLMDTTNRYGALAFATRGSGGFLERMRIDQSGNVGIGSASPQYTLDVEGSNSSATIFGKNTVSTGKGVYGYVNVNGGVGVLGQDAQAGSPSEGLLGYEGYGVYCIQGACGGGAGWTVNSDKRLKTGIEDISDALSQIQKLRPVTYHWRDIDKDKREGQQLGLIAQEVETVYPQVVNTSLVLTKIKLGDKKEEDVANTKSVQYEMLVAPLIRAVQQLKGLFDRQDDRLAKLEAANEELRREFETYKKAHP